MYRRSVGQILSLTAKDRQEVKYRFDKTHSLKRLARSSHGALFLSPPIDVALPEIRGTLSVENSLSEALLSTDN